MRHDRVCGLKAFQTIQSCLNPFDVALARYPVGASLDKIAFLPEWRHWESRNTVRNTKLRTKNNKTQKHRIDSMGGREFQCLLKICPRLISNCLKYP